MLWELIPNPDFETGEMFSEYQLKLQAASPFKTTMVLGYTNGCHGYFATQAE